jgi:DNA-directed RNA polymerase subunit RPC12/RpoP
MCGKKFQSTSHNQMFCPKCKIINKKQYNEEQLKRMKTERYLAKANEIPPQFYCGNCGKKIQLEFSPIKEKKLWREFKCPHCLRGAI